MLYSGEALAREAKHHLAMEFSDRLFDLSSAPELHGNDELVARHVLARAESLRLVDEPRKNRGRVN